MHVNRSRPSTFILEQWQSAYNAPRINRPKNDTSGFKCINKDSCTYKGEIAGRAMIVAYLQKPPSQTSDWQKICAQSDIIIAAYAPFASLCENKNAYIIKAQDLALKGSTEIFISSKDARASKDKNMIERKNSARSKEAENSPPYTIIYAQGNAARPWQSHRKYSRAARNLGPVQRN